jgi:hypothetical protein
MLDRFQTQPKPVRNYSGLQLAKPKNQAYNIDGSMLAVDLRAVLPEQEAHLVFDVE